MIKVGYDSEFDRLRELAKGGKQWISDLERDEKEKTGISNLKVKYNGAFGYFIEVTKSNLHLVPEHYIRKQTMTNAERFYTEELRQKEKEIVNAEEIAVAREQELFSPWSKTPLNSQINFWKLLTLLLKLIYFHRGEN